MFQYLFSFIFWWCLFCVFTDVAVDKTKMSGGYISKKRKKCVKQTCLNKHVTTIFNSLCF